MHFPSPLVPATLIKRYKRFLADVVFESGETATAHCANPGAMLGLAVPGNRVWLSPSPNPKAKLDWRWEIEETDGSHVGINTSHPNTLIAEAIAAGKLPGLSATATLKREVKYGINSRIDILLEEPDGERHYVEVKNVHLKRRGRAEFPDCVTARGAKHLVELAEVVRQGHRATMVYCIQRADCHGFSIAADLDPAYAAGLKVAMKSDVQVQAVQCMVSPDEIVVIGPVRLEV